MATLIILLDQNFNANYVDIMVFEASVLSPPAAVGGGGGVDDMVRQNLMAENDNVVETKEVIFKNGTDQNT